MEQNDYGSAEQRLDGAMNLFMRLEDSLGIAHSKYFLGRIYREHSKFDKSLALHEESKELFAEENHLIGVARNLNNIAICLAQTAGDLEKIESLLLQAKEIQESNPITPSYIETLRSLSRIKFMLGKSEEVNAIFDLALDTSRSLKDSGEHGATLYEIALFCRRSGDFERGLKQAEECLKIFKDMGSLRWEALIKTQRGLLFQSAKNNVRAEEDLRSSLSIFQELGDLHEQAFSYFYLYKLYELINNPELKSISFQHSYQLATKLNNSMLINLLED